ncbi:MAG: CRISPR-associated endonuclease Cas9 [Polaribacter sp. SA4-10]|nr:MAG: CRISPR-associated endonuclease Cas9 [Polaribacter sp. SA4-10]
MSSSANRTQKRAARRNLQRFKLRRKKLIEVLTENHIISTKSPLAETGKRSTHDTLFLRYKATKEKIHLDEFARVLLTINKKRGYKSNRILKNKEEGILIDGMTIAKELYDKNITVGQYVFSLLREHKNYIPDFYRSDLQREFDVIWEFQKKFYPSILDERLYIELIGSPKKQTWAICETS